MSLTPDPERPQDDAPAADRAPYRKPTLTVFGPVAALTRALSSAGATKDGGPNNRKS